eukprot:COSAG04_NODE_76_length_28498_cov_7.756294_12_plen_41_part_00
MMGAEPQPIGTLPLSSSSQFPPRNEYAFLGVSPSLDWKCR